MSRFPSRARSRNRLRLLAGVGAGVVGSVLADSASAQSMSVTGSPSTLTITTAIAGSDPISVSESTTRYSTNTLVRVSKSRITARLGSPLPPGVTLTIELAAQANASSMGQVTLSETAQAVVTDIPALSSASNLLITYRLSATAAAGAFNASSRSVILTIGS